MRDQIRELFDAVGAATAGVRRGLRGCGTRQSVPIVSNHTLNTLLLGELTARRLRIRMGIVYTTANRNWELHLANPRPIGSPDNVTRLHDGRQWSSGVRAVDLGAVVDVEDVDSVITPLDPVDEPVGAAPGSVTASQSAE